MSKQGLMHAAITAASIATFLAADADHASAYQRLSTSDSQRLLQVAGEIQRISYDMLYATLQVKSGDQVWAIIVPPSSQPQQHELLGKTLKVGQYISLFGYPDSHDTYELWAEQIVIGDRTIALS